MIIKAKKIISLSLIYRKKISGDRKICKNLILKMILTKNFHLEVFLYILLIISNIVFHWCGQWLPFPSVFIFGHIKPFLSPRFSLYSFIEGMVVDGNNNHYRGLLWWRSRWLWWSDVDGWRIPNNSIIIIASVIIIKVNGDIKILIIISTPCSARWNGPFCLDNRPVYQDGDAHPFALLFVVLVMISITNKLGTNLSQPKTITPTINIYLQRPAMY